MCDKITVIVKGRFARHDETVSSRPKFVSLACNSWQEVMQYRIGSCSCGITGHVTQQYSSSSRMRVIYHNWSATKQRPHPQSVAEISRHSVLAGDRIRQCETSSGSRHKDTDQCL